MDAMPWSEAKSLVCASSFRSFMGNEHDRRCTKGNGFNCSSNTVLFFMALFACRYKKFMVTWGVVPLFFS